MELSLTDERQVNNLMRGRKFEPVTRMNGWTEVFLPWLKQRLAEVDKKCHPKTPRFTEESIKYYIGEYNGLKQVLDEVEVILKEFREAIEYCDDKHINI